MILSGEIRGSLFTHQELAIAYVLDFPHAIFVCQEGTELAGLGEYLLTNARTFSHLDQVVGLVKELVRKQKWSPGYSRHLVICGFDRPKSPKIDDSADRYVESYTWLALVANSRPDLPARRTVAHLIAAWDESGEEIELGPAGIRPLWWDLFPFELPGVNLKDEVDLLPGESKFFNALSIYSGKRDEFTRYEEDRISEGIQGIGVYRLRYQVLAERFPPLEFDVEVNLTGKAETTTGKLLR